MPVVTRTESGVVTPRASSQHCRVITPSGLPGLRSKSTTFISVQWMAQLATGQRVAQYCPEQPSYLRCDDTYQESGYRHNLITIGSGNNADRTNIVQTWGLGLAIRPYGEWEYPYRPYATPYSAWGGYGGPQNPGPMPYNAWQNPYAAGPQQGYGPNYCPYPQPYGPQGAQSFGQFSNGPGGGAGPGGNPSGGGPGPTPSPHPGGGFPPPAPTPPPHSHPGA